MDIEVDLDFRDVESLGWSQIQNCSEVRILSFRKVVPFGCHVSRIAEECGMAAREMRRSVWALNFRMSSHLDDQKSKIGSSGIQSHLAARY